MSQASSQSLPHRFPVLSSPTSFVLARTKWAVKIVPRTGATRSQWIGLAMIPVIGLAIGFLVDEVAVATFALILGACVWLARRVFDRGSLRRGPWLIFRLADGIVELPRLRITVPRCHRKEFHLLTHEESDGFASVKLTLVAWDSEGNKIHYPLVGEMPRELGDSDLDRLIVVLSKATAIPVRRERLPGDQADCTCQRCGSGLYPSADRCGECGYQYLVLSA